MEIGKSDMNKKFFLLVFTIFMISHPAWARDTTEELPVSGFHYYNGHIGLLVKQTVMKYGDGCQRNDWYILEKSHPYYKEIVALVMTAHFTGQPLTFGVEGCVQNFPAIQHVVSKK